MPEDLTGLLTSGGSEIAWWIVAALSAHVYRARVAWRKREADLVSALAARDARITALLVENALERGRSDALNAELTTLTQHLWSSQ